MNTNTLPIHDLVTPGISGAAVPPLVEKSMQRPAITIPSSLCVYSSRHGPAPRGSQNPKARPSLSRKDQVLEDGPDDIEPLTVFIRAVNDMW
jgi:hypothetical protein